MITRRRLVIALGVTALSHPSLATAQRKLWRIGILAPSRRPEIYEALSRRLQDFGYFEGKNLSIEFRIADGHYDRLPELAAQLVQLQVDVIMTDATPGAEAAQKATTTIPIVFVVGDPVSAGLVKSLARPEGNATGMSVFTTEMTVKQREILVTALPKLSSIALLLNPANSSHGHHLETLRRTTKMGGVRIVPIEASKREDLERAFTLMTSARVGAFIVVADPFLNQHLGLIAKLAAESRLPSIGVNPVYAELGGLMSYGADPRENWSQVARFVDKIFRGAQPRDLPIEQPTKLVLILNRPTASLLGLTLPQDLLLRVDKVIE